MCVSVSVRGEGSFPFVRQTPSPRALWKVFPPMHMVNVSKLALEMEPQYKRFDVRVTDYFSQHGQCSTVQWALIRLQVHRKGEEVSRPTQSERKKCLFSML